MVYDNTQCILDMSKHCQLFKRDIPKAFISSYKQCRIIKKKYGLIKYLKALILVTFKERINMNNI